MKEQIKKLAHQADDYADAMDYLGKNYIGLRDNYFAELIALECIKMIENEAAQYAQPTWAVELVNDIKENFGIEP